MSIADIPAVGDGEAWLSSAAATAVKTGAGCSGSAAPGAWRCTHRTVVPSEYVCTAGNTSSPPGSGPAETAKFWYSPGLMPAPGLAVHVTVRGALVSVVP